MASPVDVPKGTNQILRMGQTAGAFGNDPMAEGKGSAGEKARDLRP
jgi:hypothetical protein